MANLGMDVLKIEFDYDYLGRRVQKRARRKNIAIPPGGPIGGGAVDREGDQCAATAEIEGAAAPRLSDLIHEVSIVES